MTLLRNDSVTDWVERSETYHAMIILLRRMVDCELTVECLIQQRWEKSKSCGLEEWMWDDGEITWEMEKGKPGRPSSVFARDPPLFDSFKRLNKQCEAFLAGASQVMFENGNDDDVEEMVQATSICGDITAAGDDIERAIVALGRLPSPNHSGYNAELEEPPKADMSRPMGKGKNRDPAVDMEKIDFPPMRSKPQPRTHRENLIAQQCRGKRSERYMHPANAGQREQVSRNFGRKQRDFVAGSGGRRGNLIVDPALSVVGAQAMCHNRDSQLMASPERGLFPVVS